jgi:pyridinium-3,5-biscarboxylic acid mononucleotide sulfurtransferase
LTRFAERPYLDPMLEIEAKENQLLRALADGGRLIVAYSGGVDSAYLAHAAHRALGDDMLAVTAESPSYPRSHRAMAERIASEVGFRHRFVATHEMQDPDYARNPSNRCYFCKSELFTVLESLRRELGFGAVAYGINRDDQGDFRPGHRAAEEHRVRSPLLDAGLGKAEIRELSRRAGLSAAELPASACLSSRIPYGTEVTPEKLQQIDRAEDALRALGYGQVRVRHHGELARIELEAAELDRALQPEQRRAIARAVHEQGFRWVSLDLDGYRTGSLNEVLQIAPAPRAAEPS